MVWPAYGFSLTGASCQIRDWVISHTCSLLLPPPDEGRASSGGIRALSLLLGLVGACHMVHGAVVL